MKLTWMQWSALPVTVLLAGSVGCWPAAWQWRRINRLRAHSLRRKRRAQVLRRQQPPQQRQLRRRNQSRRLRSAKKISRTASREA